MTSKHQPADVDQPVVAIPPRPRERDRDRAKLAEATDRVVALEQSLSEANARIETLESDVAARQIRETDLAARLLDVGRRLREAERLLELRKRGQ